jgi:putative thioredoxin
VADSRVRDFRHPLYRRIEMLEAMTLPDLAEPEEFRHVSLTMRGALESVATGRIVAPFTLLRDPHEPGNAVHLRRHDCRLRPVGDREFLPQTGAGGFLGRMVCAVQGADADAAEIAESYQGELLLAKVNCDIEQDIVARFGIRSLPTVVLFKDGQPVDGFAGAQPESAVRAMLEPHVQMPPPAADPFEQAQALFAEAASPTPKPAQVLLGEDNSNAKALILYARCLTERGELGEAQAVLDAVKSDEHKAALAGAKAQITFLARPRPAGCRRAEGRLAQNPQDDEAVYQLAVQQLARQQYDAALDGLLKLFIRNRSYSEGLPHKTCCRCSNCSATITRW